MSELIKTVNASAGTAAQFATSNAPYSVISVRARPSNGSAVYVGDSSVTSTNGLELLPGDSYDFAGVNKGDTVNISFFWLDSASGTDSADIIANNS